MNLHLALTNQLHGALESPPQPGTACEDVDADVSAARGADEREERHSDNGAEAGDLDISSSARRSVRWQESSFKVGTALCFAAAEADWIGKIEAIHQYATPQ